MTTLEPQRSKIDRPVAVLAAPFVLGWDLTRSMFFGLCRAMEKLDPFAALSRVFSRLTPPLARIIRRWWATTLPFRLRVLELWASAYRLFLAMVRPVVRAASPIVERVGRLIARGVRSVAATVGRSAAAVRQFAEPGISRVRQIFGTIRQIFGSITVRMTAPIRRAVVAVRAAAARGAFWS